MKKKHKFHKLALKKLGALDKRFGVLTYRLEEQVLLIRVLQEELQSISEELEQIADEQESFANRMKNLTN